MLTPGKQHNFRVSADANWTDAFNRIADKNKWSSNKTMNVLIHSALNMNDMTDESITVEISPEEFKFLLRLRQTPDPEIILPQEKATKKTSSVVQQPVVELEPEPEQPQATARQETAASDDSEENDEKLAKKNAVLEKAMRQFKATKI